MDRLRRMRPPLRAALAVAALYGVLLQAFLTGLAPAPTGFDHSAFCAPAGGSAPAGESGRTHDACCLAACFATSVVLPAGQPGSTFRHPAAIAFLPDPIVPDATRYAKRPFDPRGPPTA